MPNVQTCANCGQSVNMDNNIDGVVCPDCGMVLHEETGAAD